MPEVAELALVAVGAESATRLSQRRRRDRRAMRDGRHEMNTNAILVLNSGSSSLKFGVYSTEAAPFVGAALAPPGVKSDRDVTAQASPSDSALRPLYRGEIEGIAAGEGKIWLKDAAAGKTNTEESRNFAQQSDAAKAVAEKLAKLKLPGLEGIGHRVVHGGPSLTAHQKITPSSFTDARKLPRTSLRCTFPLRSR